MKNLKKGLFLLFALAFVCGISWLEVSSQTSESGSKNGVLMFSFGNGFSYAGKGPQSKAGGGFSIRTALEHEQNGFVFSLCITGNQGGKANYDDYLKNNGNSKELLYDFKHELFFDFGFQIGGVVELNPRFCFVAMTGISVVTGKRIVIKEDNGFFSSPDFYDYYVDRKFSYPSIGIPFEARVQYKISRAMAVGLSTHANINPEESFFGISINLIKRLN